jgi:hypothetical protein
MRNETLLRWLVQPGTVKTPDLRLGVSALKLDGLDFQAAGIAG